MSGINKRSNQPLGDQKKIKINPLYNTSSILKGALDRIGEALSPSKPKKKSK